MKNFGHPEQLGLNFDGYDEPNRYGAYADCERLQMPRGQSRGSAEIRIASTAKGFLWGSAAMTEQQGYGGYPNVCDVQRGQVMPSRGEAIKQACDEIYHRLHRVKTKASAAILSWADAIKQAA